MAPRAFRASPLRVPHVPRTPFQPRAAVTESENSACVFFPTPRSVDGILGFSMDPVSLAAFRVDTDFNRDSSTGIVFSTAVQGGNAAQTAFTHQHNEGANIGEPYASFIPTRPESTDYTRQPNDVVRGASHVTPR